MYPLLMHGSKGYLCSLTWRGAQSSRTSDASCDAGRLWLSACDFVRQDAFNRCSPRSGILQDDTIIQT